MSFHFHLTTRASLRDSTDTGIDQLYLNPKVPSPIYPNPSNDKEIVLSEHWIHDLSDSVDA